MTTEGIEFLVRAEEELRRLSSEDKALAAQEDGVRRKRAELARRLAALQTAIETYRELMDVQPEPRPATSELFEPPLKQGTVGDMTYELLGRHGRPMKVGDIATALEAAGKLTPGADARGNYATVYGTINRDARFLKTGTGEFGIAGRDAPADERAARIHADIQRNPYDFSKPWVRTAEADEIRQRASGSSGAVGVGETDVQTT